MVWQPGKETRMKSVLAIATAILSLVDASSAAGALSVGDPAPSFSIRRAVDGTITTVDLSELLKKGPVVIFFFPSAFTDAPECREFAKNIDRFRAAGLNVVGISRDSVDTLTRFSTDECAGKFPIASADESLVNGFDVNDGAMFNTRTTYVIAPSGKIVFVYENDDYNSHIKCALAFVHEAKK
jgi:peroxiredoxin